MSYAILQQYFLVPAVVFHGIACCHARFMVLLFWRLQRSVYARPPAKGLNEILSLLRKTLSLPSC